MEGMQNFQSPESIRKMIDPKERAKMANLEAKKQILKMIENGEITTDDFDELYEKAENRRSTQATC
ncbi:MAG: hypothetical protein ACD_9C00254G0010 [uncultured bacterium]|nr:MAG: hypothetical protein ACD_9C00254G0010 [uncultured bacterium]